MASLQSLKQLLAKNLLNKDLSLTRVLRNQFDGKKVHCALEEPHLEGGPFHLLFLFIKKRETDSLNPIYLNAVKDLVPDVLRFVKSKGIEPGAYGSGYSEQNGGYYVSIAFRGNLEAAKLIEKSFNKEGLQK